MAKGKKATSFAELAKKVNNMGGEKKVAEGVEVDRAEEVDKAEKISVSTAMDEEVLMEHLFELFISGATDKELDTFMEGVDMLSEPYRELLSETIFSHLNSVGKNAADELTEIEERMIESITGAIVDDMEDDIEKERVNIEEYIKGNKDYSDEEEPVEIRYTDENGEWMEEEEDIREVRDIEEVKKEAKVEEAKVEEIKVKKEEPVVKSYSEHMRYKYPTPENNGRFGNLQFARNGKDPRENIKRE